MFGVAGSKDFVQTPTHTALKKLRADAEQVAGQMQSFLAGNPAEAHKAAGKAMALASQAALFGMHPQVAMEIALSLHSLVCTTTTTTATDTLTKLIDKTNVNAMMKTKYKD